MLRKESNAKPKTNTKDDLYINKDSNNKDKDVKFIENPILKYYTALFKVK